MPLNLTASTADELKPKIVVIGVGGAGGNAVNNMIESELDGVTFVCANTDAQAVGLSKAENKIQLGTNVTQGLGAGSRPQIGEAAAEESLDDLMTALEGANMLFITAGMGGGTGTGAAPVIAKAARDLGILTVGVVTKPFAFEGARRMRIADEGIEELSRHVDTLLIIPNQNLFRLADENTTFADAFAMADEVLHSGVKGITDLMIVPGHINLDFADVRTVMSEMGKAMMGTGEATGESRASVAAAAAISNPLLDEMSLKGAKGVLINITGGLDMKLFEVDEAANAVRNEVDPEANIIVGSTFDQELQGTIRVSVVATGIDSVVSETVLQAPRPSVSAAPAASSPVQHQAQVRPEPQHQPALSPVPSPALEVEIDQSPENPVGEVHERIRRILTEDPAPQARDDQAAAMRPNPFRGRQPSTLETAMGVLREAFKAPKDQAAQGPARRLPSARPLTDEEDEVEVPAFLRRQ